MADTSSTRIDLKRYPAETQAHRHPHHQIVLPLEGVLEMDVAGRFADVAADRAAVIPAGQWHSFAGSDDNAFLVIDLAESPPDTGAGGSVLWRAALEHPFMRFDPSLGGFCQFIANRIGHQGLHGVRSEVAGSMVLDALAQSQNLAPNALPPALARAIRFIETYYDDAITVATVAHNAGLSESRLHALFHGWLDTSPGRYLARQRVRRARLLLEETATPVADIALAVGYSDQSAFTRAFRRETGKTPAAYRRACRVQ